LNRLIALQIFSQILMRSKKKSAKKGQLEFAKPHTERKKETDSNGNTGTNKRNSA
jgi:hypothetical protein